MRKSLIIFLILGGIALGIGVFNNLVKSGDIKPITTGLASNTQVPQNEQLISPLPVTLPVTFSIPKLKVKSQIESVGLDSQNKMDIPKDENNVAWYNLGVKPGEKGNAVMAGHFDKKTGEPAVFYDIGKLKPGDEIIVEDGGGKEYKFVVTEIATYPVEDFPLEGVFGAFDKPRLNLITCEGTYDKTSKLYSHRLVVYSELKS